MVSSKASTPQAELDHPAENLRIGTPNERSVLSKLTPITLPNDDLVLSLQKQYPKDERWKTFRNDYQYIYVMNWMHQCRGYVRLGGELFDVDLFEIELFNLVYPPPLDDMHLLLHKARLALLSKVNGKRVESLALFEQLFRLYFGVETPLGGSEDDETLLDNSVLFDDLFIDQKIEILYLLMSEVSLYSDFRDFIERSKLSPEMARPLQLFRAVDPQKPSHLEEYVLVFDGTAVYKRVVVAPSLVIPKKRRLCPEDPEEAFGEDSFDAEKITYELVYKSIFDLDAFIEELKVNRNKKKNRLILEVIKKPAAVSNVFEYETRKRRILMSRRKENEMARLLATRKKSSRLEAKVKQRNEEEQERKLRELEDLQYSTSRRSQRNYHILENKLKSDFTAGLSRGERLNLRKGANFGDEELVDFSPSRALTVEIEDPEDANTFHAVPSNDIEDPVSTIQCDALPQNPDLKTNTNDVKITQDLERLSAIHDTNNGHSIVTQITTNSTLNGISQDGAN